MVGNAGKRNDHRKETCQAKAEERTGKGHDDLVQGRNGGQRLCAFRATFQRAHGSHLRQTDKTARGNAAQAIVHAVDGLLPDRLAEPDLKGFDLKAAPFGGEEVSEFVNHDHQVEHHDDQEEDAEKPECGKNEIHRGSGNITPGPFRRKCQGHYIRVIRVSVIHSRYHPVAGWRGAPPRQFCPFCPRRGCGGWS